MYPRRYVGRHLIPRPKKHGPAVLGTAAALWVAGPAAHAGTGGHVVRPGDTLSELAARYGTSVSRLARANDLADPDLIVIGTTLRIRGAGAEAPSRTHRVTRGETLSGIAARYGTSVRSLARRNHLADPNLILAGTTLQVPGTTHVSVAHTGGSIESVLERHSSAAGIDASLVKAVAWHESGWQQDVVSSAGAIGVMQVMPDTADYVNVVLGGGSLDVRKADDNVKLGVMYLSRMLQEKGSEDRALAAYYSGPGNVRGRLNREQRAYVAAVQANRARYRH